MLNTRLKDSHKNVFFLCFFWFFFYTECDACWASAAVSERQIAISPSMRRTALWQYPSHIEPRSLG